MNTKNESPHMIDVLFILTLFLVFALSSISVVGIGIQVYRTIVTDMDSNYNSRTAIAYVTEKLREADTSGSVRLGSIDDCDALILSQTTVTKSIVLISMPMTETCVNCLPQQTLHFLPVPDKALWKSAPFLSTRSRKIYTA